MNKFKLSASKNNFLNNLSQKTSTFLKKIFSIDKSMPNKYNIFLIFISLFFLLLLYVLIKGFIKEGMTEDDGDGKDEEDDEEGIENLEEEVCQDNINKPEENEENEGILDQVVELTTDKENFTEPYVEVKPYDVELFAPF